MRNKNKQKGMTIWGLVFVLAVIAFVVFLIFKLLPPYLNYFKVRGALDSLARQSDVGSMSRAQINEALYKRFDIDDVKYVQLGKDLSIENRGGLRIIRIRYETVEPMVGNISLLMDFDYSIQVSSSGE